MASHLMTAEYARELLDGALDQLDEAQRRKLPAWVASIEKQITALMVIVNVAEKRDERRPVADTPVEVNTGSETP